jgi:hypothetical protein
VSFIDQHKEERGRVDVQRTAYRPVDVIASTPGAGESPSVAQLAISATTSCALTLHASTRTTNSATVRRRSGGSCAEKTFGSLAAPRRANPRAVSA